MKQLFKRHGNILFWLIVCVHLTGILTGNTALIFITKPLLVPLLLIVAMTGRARFGHKMLLLAGLAFSFAGDVFLLLEKQQPSFFIIGLICFLLTHIFYILFFLRIRSTEPSALRAMPWLILPVLAYVASLLFLLVPVLGALKIPVIAYALVLGAMLLASIHVYFKAGKQNGTCFVSGACCFVLSDSLLAIHKFYAPFPFAAVAIMLTYCLAQWLIVKGAVAHN